MCSCNYICRCYNRYGFLNFFWDCFMVVMTFGFWLIWIYCRERRNRC